MFARHCTGGMGGPPSSPMGMIQVGRLLKWRTRQSVVDRLSRCLRRTNVKAYWLRIRTLSERRGSRTRRTRRTRAHWNNVFWKTSSTTVQVADRSRFAFYSTTCESYRRSKGRSNTEAERRDAPAEPEEMSLIITSVETDCSFWAQMSESKLQQLQEWFKSWCPKTPAVQIGQICGAVFEEDSNWYCCKLMQSETRMKLI
ncbi:uncharacterized protein [Oscarella lobularis]|uniref:uncharacterized protein n=1 Tax=Oscarella lobularis TaxID=121494 RepID=UPI0033140F60